jgi:hypothetical protein
MIKCIKRIAGIGNFDSYDTTKTKLRKDFNNLNIIFGLNTYGKSTLCDVFKDINDDSTERIIKRKTIRCGKEYNSTDIKQNVVISTDCNTSTLSLTNNAWCNNNLKNRIYVFDTEFMYNNIFDGLSILDSYERKVNFTNYIIGEEGVKLAKKIEDNKKVLKLKNERIKELIPISQKDKNEKYILKYVQWKPNNTKAEIEARIIEKTSIFESKNKILNNNDRIIKYNDNNVTEYNEVKILKDKITQLNNILQRTYHIPSDIIGKIENHIANNMKNYVKAKAWLNTGYKNINQEIELCPFCGQALNKSDFYQTIKMYFDNSFQDYINEIASSIRSLEIKWDCTHLTEEIQKHRLLIHEEKGIFINSLDEIYDELTKLNEKVVKYEEELDKLLTDMEYNYSNFIDQKMSAPQISIDLLNHDLFTRLDDYQKYIDLFYSILDKKRKIITSMKQTLNSGTLERKLPQTP